MTDKPYSIIIHYSTIADLKREAARLLGEDLDGLRRDLDEALDDAATLRESLAAAREKLAEVHQTTEAARQWLGGAEGEPLLAVVRRALDALGARGDETIMWLT